MARAWNYCLKLLFLSALLVNTLKLHDLIKSSNGPILRFSIGGFTSRSRPRQVLSVASDGHPIIWFKLMIVSTEDYGLILGKDFEHQGLNFPSFRVTLAPLATMWPPNLNPSGSLRGSSRLYHLHLGAGCRFEFSHMVLVMVSVSV